MELVKHSKVRCKNGRNCMGVCIHQFLHLAMNSCFDTEDIATINKKYKHRYKCAICTPVRGHYEDI